MDGLDSTGARPECVGRPGKRRVDRLRRRAALIASGDVAALIASGEGDGARACDGELNDEMKTAGRVVVCARQVMH